LNAQSAFRKGTNTLDHFLIAFSDPQGSGRLIWGFGDFNFSLPLYAGLFDFDA
jgi:hypothetical protein